MPRMIESYAIGDSPSTIMPRHHHGQLDSLRRGWLVLVQAVDAAVGSAKVPIGIVHRLQPRDMTEQFAPGILDGA